MGSEWINLEDLVTIKGGKRLPKGTSLQSSKNKHPYIRVKDMGQRFIPRIGLEYVPDEVFIEIQRYIVEENDLIISIVGTVGLVSIIDKYLHTASQTENCAKLSGLDQNDALYLYYYLISAQGQQEISTQTVGAVQPKLPLYGIEKISVYWPSKKKRENIGNILGSLDDKIELNRQMNETLEAMAQALFKSWFVDFDPVIDNALAAGHAIPDVFAERAAQRKAMNKDEAINPLFPDAFEYTEEMGWIPKGWKVRQLKTFGKIVTGKTPPKKIDTAYSETGTPFITPTDIDDALFVFSTNRFLSEDGIKSVKNSTLASGSICVTCIGSQMGKTTISPSDSVSNQQINAITECEKHWRNFLFFDLRRRKEEIFLLGSSGSTMPILNKSNFEMLPIVSPDEELVLSLNIHFQSALDSVLNNTAQSYSLSKLRDTLLPKLLSGELCIPDVEKLVKEAQND